LFEVYDLGDENEAKRAFALYDYDSDGRMDKKEFISIMNSQGVVYPPFIPPRERKIGQASRNLGS